MGVKLGLTLRLERGLRVFEDGVFRRIFGPKRDKVIGDWRKHHTEDVNHLCLSVTILSVIKWRIIRWAGHVARMWEGRGMTGFW
jgi:hypothetical protein